MADNSSRSYRRDALARATEPSARDGMADPLEELARLIGQSDPNWGRVHGAMPTDHFEDAQRDSELEGMAGESGYRERTDKADVAHAAPRPTEAYWSRPSDAPSLPDDRDYENDGAAADQYLWSAAQSAEPREEARRNALAQDADPELAPGAVGWREYPASRFSAASEDDRIDEQQQYDDPSQSYAQGYAQGEYDAADRPSLRRRGTVVLLAVLGLAVLGAAGAFGYRVTFGGSVLPSLPPIIKPAPGPIKIVPADGATPGAGSSETDAVTKDSEARLVSHQEHPVDLSDTVAPARVVTTIPVITDTPDSLPGAISPSASVAPEPPATQSTPAPPATASPAPAAPGEGSPATAPTPEQLTGVAPLSLPGAKEVHTVIIRPDQPASPLPTPTAQASAVQPAPRHENAPMHQTATRSRKVARPAGASAGPLSIVPTQEDRGMPPQQGAHAALARPSRTQPLALRSTPASAAPVASGGYAVQVSSQRSEAEAQAAFSSLQAKYPEQLAGRHAIVRRADLGAKGTYYRALVGPFSSAAEAAGLCRRLKAVGGRCIVQRI